jgi:hypothetical protein
VKIIKRIAFSVLALIIGIVFIVIGSGNLSAVKNYTQIQARVTAINRTPSADPDSTAENITVYVEYDLSGQRFNEILQDPPAKVNEGDVITVRYNPDKPDYVTGATTTSGVLCLAFGSVAVIAGLGSAALFILRGKKR